MQLLAYGMIEPSRHPHSRLRGPCTRTESSCCPSAHIGTDIGCAFYHTGRQRTPSSSPELQLCAIPIWFRSPQTDHCASRDPNETCVRHLCLAKEQTPNRHIWPVALAPSCHCPRAVFL